MTHDKTLTAVVGFDFTELSELALGYACSFCSRFAPTEIHVITVLDASLEKRGVVHRLDYDNAFALQKRLAAHIEPLAERFEMSDTEIAAHTRIGAAADKIIDLAEEVTADVVAVGTHGRAGLERLLVGSVAEEVVRKATCPVLVARPVDYQVAESEGKGVPEPEPPAPGDQDREVPEPHVYRYSSGIAPTRDTAWPLY